MIYKRDFSFIEFDKIIDVNRIDIEPSKEIPKPIVNTIGLDLNDDISDTEKDIIVKKPKRKRIKAMKSDIGLLYSLDDIMAYFCINTEKIYDTKKVQNDKMVAHEYIDSKQAIDLLECHKIPLENVNELIEENDLKIVKEEPILKKQKIEMKECPRCKRMNRIEANWCGGNCRYQFIKIEE
jgi:hypothetical protein